MLANGHDTSRPIRVVVFTSGPVLEWGVKRFIYRLALDADIELLAVFSQSAHQGLGAVAQDLWRRRRFLALPVFLVQLGRSLGRYLAQPRTKIELEQKIREESRLIHFVPDIHAETVLAHVRALAPDLGLIYGAPLLKPVLFDIPTYGTLGIHHGKLPEYRGKKTTFWAMYNGEETVGVTIQRVNAGLDTGQIVAQGDICVGNKSFYSVWNELEALGLDIYIQAIRQIKQGNAKFSPAIGRKTKLYRDPKLQDMLVFWWRRARVRHAIHQDR